MIAPVIASVATATPTPTPTVTCWNWNAPPYYGTVCGPPDSMTIASPSPSLTPSATPTATPTPTPKPTASATPTLAPTKAPSPTPSPTATPAAVSFVTGDKSVKATISITPTTGAVLVTFTKTSTTPAAIILTNKLRFSSVVECVGEVSCGTPVVFPDSSPVYFSLVASPTYIEFGAPVAAIDGIFQIFAGAYARPPGAYIATYPPIACDPAPVPDRVSL